MRFFEGMNESQKLKYLLIKQDYIDEEERLRMNDVIQSYDVMDSEQFHIAKSIAEELEKNPDFELIIDDS